MAPTGDVNGGARERKEHHQRCRAQREEDRLLARQPDAREVETECRLAHAKSVHRNRQHLKNARERHGHREVERADVNAERVHNGEMKDHAGHLHQHGAAEAACERAWMVSEPFERRRHVVDPEADPLRTGEHGGAFVSIKLPDGKVLGDKWTEDIETKGVVGK